ncbi:MAG: ATP-grasp domain-containing protein [Pirellulaceae bacterium]
MSQQPNIIVVGASARAAAFSALRAGMRPYAIDLFADCDLADVCPAVKIKRYPQDFEDALAAAPQAPWIYTGGLENHPDLVDRMATIRPLYGNGGEVLRKIRDPKLLADCLALADVKFGVPEIRDSISPRDPNKQWLRKPRRSSGGLGIRRVQLNVEHENNANHYFQEQVQGDAWSAVFIADSSGCRHMGITEQQSGVADLTDEPFLYAGSATSNLPRNIDGEYREGLEDLGRLLAGEFGLQGIFNVDMVGDHWLLEVNPRYSASVEVLEHLRGENFLAMHMAVFDPNFQVEKRCGISKSPSHVAKQVVYAGIDCLVTPELHRLRKVWNVERLLPGLADIPRPGDRILRGQPIVTVIAEGCNDDEVQRLLNERVTAVRRTLMPEEDRNLTQRHQGTEENAQ